MAASASVVSGGVSKLQICNKLNNFGEERSSENVAISRSFSSSNPKFPRLSLRRPPLCSSKCRLSNDGRTIVTRSLKMRNNLWRQKGFILTEQMPLATLTRDRMYLCCNHTRRKSGSFARSFSSRFSSDKSTFPLSKNVLDTMKQHHVRCSAVGPDEPHAVSASCPEEISEKPGLDFLDLELRREEVEEFLNTELLSHPKLYRGQLKNGLRYIILPNKVPPNRFEAHMEVHVGSIDEEDDEQGIAHMIEHVAFLGSKKREKLLGTGARSNAYTDFHHTVFHIHSPTHAKVRCFYPSDIAI